jgi:hypothetical protein
VKQGFDRGAFSRRTLELGSDGAVAISIIRLLVDEMSEVLDFLKSRVGRVYSVREISKEVDPDRFERDKTWASHELKGLCNKGFIEVTNGFYWIPQEKDRSEESENESEEREEKPSENEASGDADPTGPK